MDWGNSVPDKTIPAGGLALRRSAVAVKRNRRAAAKHFCPKSGRRTGHAPGSLRLCQPGRRRFSIGIKHCLPITFPVAATKQSLNNRVMGQKDKQAVVRALVACSAGRQKGEGVVHVEWSIALPPVSRRVLQGNDRRREDNGKQKKQKDGRMTSDRHAL